jgi:tetratricopeptide (TPR) repeat protein
MNGWRDSLGSIAVIVVMFLVMSAAIAGTGRKFWDKSVRQVPRPVFALLVVVGIAAAVLASAVTLLNREQPGSGFDVPARQHALVDEDSLNSARRRLVSIDTVIDGVNLAARGRFSDAVERYNVALSLDPQNAEALGYRGYTLYRLGRLDQALADLQRAEKLDPQSSWHPYNEALVLWARQDTVGAIAAVQRAISIDSGIAPVMVGDPQFGSLRSLPAFRNVVGPSVR